MSDMIVYEKIQMACPIERCDGKLEYVAYTAFSCRKCKNGFSIKINQHPKRAILTTDGCEEHE